MKRKKFLNNKDIMEEIHKSKASYCSFIDDEYQYFDVVIQDKKEVTKDLIYEAKVNKADSMVKQKKLELKELGYKPHQINVSPIPPENIKDEDIVIRLITYEHIPLDENRKRKPRNEAEKHVKINFTPFIHLVVNDWEGEKPIFKEVGKSHWEGGIHNGYFSQDKGDITNKLAVMYLKLVEKYGQKGNWRGYSYLEDMKGDALAQLVTAGLKFDEHKSDNPFAYYTAIMATTFTKVLNNEKRKQNTRDNLLIQAGVAPSYTKQIEDEMKQKEDNDKEEKDKAEKGED